MARLSLLLCLPLAAAFEEEHDQQALVQTRYEVSQAEGLLQREGSTLLGRAALLSELTAPEKTKLKRDFNCSKFPDFCREPFNCQKPHDADQTHNVAWKDGHARLNTWCGSTAYYPYMTTCMQKKDLVLAAEIQYNWTIEQPGGVNELDGSYCFMEGHCSNTAVTNQTTLAEAEKMCDYRYGHKGWTRWNAVKNDPGAILSMAWAASPKTGFHDRKITRMFLKMACAMGNYHCDVMYCKETYCKKDYYIKKYGHLQPKTLGHNIRDLK